MSFQFALITPSYAPDFERCRLLCQSVEKFISPSVPHYIIVEQRDLPLFRQIQSSHTEIITVESVLPWWLKRLPLVKNGWLSFKTFPIRNWITQQLVKISVGTYFLAPWDLTPLYQKFKPDAAYTMFSSIEEFDEFYPHYIPYLTKHHRERPSAAYRLFVNIVGHLFSNYAFTVSPNLATVWVRRHSS